MYSVKYPIIIWASEGREKKSYQNIMVSTSVGKKLQTILAVLRLTCVVLIKFLVFVFFLFYLLFFNGILNGFCF